MTLIDGDRIVTAQLYDDEYEEFKEQKMSIIDYVNAYTDEGVTTADDVLDKIRAEIEGNMESIIGKYDSSIPKFNMPSYKIERNKTREECISIIDKYRTGGNETQTNEIVYDVGGHMYGAMGGDVIMDILAGKGKE